MSDSPAVLVEGLEKAYGPVKALDGIDFVPLAVRRYRRLP